MEHFLKLNTLIESLSDLCSIHLAIIGICLTVFTLLYSFIFAKRSDLDAYSESLKSKLADPLIAQKYGQNVRYINKLKKVCHKCLIAFFSSCFLWIVSWIDKTFIILKEFGVILFFILLALTLIYKIPAKSVICQRSDEKII